MSAAEKAPKGYTHVRFGLNNLGSIVVWVLAPDPRTSGKSNLHALNIDTGIWYVVGSPETLRALLKYAPTHPLGRWVKLEEIRASMGSVLLK